MTQVHLVNHTHWDREWYFTDMDAQVLADSLFSEAIAELKREKTMNFTLDGQSSIVDEYVQTHPKALVDIRELVDEGRLFVGPWYTQTDAVNVDPESILRNAIIGQLETKEKYGQPMKVGYLPDTFGFNANLPALLTHVELNRFIFWRGMNYDAKVKSPFFKWEAPNGSSVLAVNLPPTGYSAAHMTDQVKKDVKGYVTKRLDPTGKFVHDIRGDDLALLPVGMDQMNIIHDFPKLLEQINKISVNDNILSNYPAFFDALENVAVPTYKGELRDPIYARVHRSISSVRSDLKVANARSELKILRRLEPLMVIAAHNNVHISATMLIQVWKIVLECQAHDSMGGSVTDNVAVDIEHRFKQANELIDSIENMIKFKLAEAMQLTDKQVLLFNTDTHVFSGRKTFSVFSQTADLQFPAMKNVELLKRVMMPARDNVLDQTTNGIRYITEPQYYELTYQATVSLPALGFKVFNFEPTDKDTAFKVVDDDELSATGITIKLTDGLIDVTTANGAKYLLGLTDSGNDGDTYDYSPVRGEPEKALHFDQLRIKTTAFSKVATFTGQAAIPFDLEDRSGKSDDFRVVHYAVELNVASDTGLLEGTIKVNNVVNSHRVRLSLVSADKDARGIAQIQDAFEDTPNVPIPDDWEKQMVEKPVNIFTFNKTVSLVGNDDVATLISNDLHEYQADSGKLFVTLFSSTGQLGKPNLAWRPGRASGDTTNRGHIMMATPLAQTKGRLNYQFAIAFSSRFNKAAVVNSENSFLAANVSYQRQLFNRFANRLDNKIWPEDSDEPLAHEQSVLELPTDINVAAIYPSFTDEDAYIVRVVNLSDTTIPLPNKLAAMIQVDGLEEKVPALTELAPGTIASFKQHI